MMVHFSCMAVHAIWPMKSDYLFLIAAPACDLGPAPKRIIIIKFSLFCVKIRRVSKDRQEKVRSSQRTASSPGTTAMYAPVCTALVR